MCVNNVENKCLCLLPSTHHQQFLVHKTLSKTNMLCRVFEDSRRPIVAYLHSSSQHMKIPRNEELINGFFLVA